MAGTKPSVTVQAAYIAGTFALLAAGVYVLGPHLLRYLDERRGLEIMNIDLVREDGNIGVDVVLRNKSSLPQAVTSASLTWSRWLPPSFEHRVTCEVTMARKVYLLRPSVELKSWKASPVYGTAEALPDRPKRGPLYEVEGTWKLFADDDWSVNFTLPVREELQPGQNFSLAVLVPATIPVTEISAEETLDTFGEFVSDDPPREFRLLKFLVSRGFVQMNFTATYGENRKATFEEPANF